MSVNPVLWERAAGYLRTLSISRGHAGSGDKNLSNTSNAEYALSASAMHLSRGKWRVGRARVVALRVRCWKVGAAPGPTDPIASEEGGGSPWSGVRQGCPRLSFGARSSHCQVLAFPLTHSPERGSQWCQITPGVPTPRLPGVCGCSC